MVGPLHNLNFCDVDGFPLVNIDGQINCSAEHADGLIGGQTVTGIEERDQHIELVFDSCLCFPLTCSCCDGPLHRQFSLEDLRRIFCSPALEGFCHGEFVGRGHAAGAPPDVRAPVLPL